MALDIRPPAANSTNKSGSVSSKQSANAGSSGADLFATHLAQSTKSSSRQASAPKQTSASKIPRDKSPSASDKQDASAKASAADGSDKSGAAAARPSKTSSAKANAQPNKNGSASGDKPDSQGAASASEENSAAGSPNTNGTSKGRAPARGAAAKVSAPPAAADGQAIDVAADPSTDTSNASGLSLLQLLAQASEGENSSAPLADDTVDTGTDPSADDSGSSQTDPNALALAMLSQAFAAGFAPPATAPMGAAAQGTSPSATTDATTDGTGTTGAIDANGRSSGSSAQQLVTLLAQDLAAQAQGKTDSDATRSDVASTKGFSETAGSANGTVPTADSAAQSLAQLGVASHFSRDTNLTELKAPVGSPAWNEELGGHLTWMTHRGLESGSLHVSPEHLGPVEVQITVQNGDASVWFGASHPDTRAALEQALPRLREMFASQGLTLSDSGVSREPPRNQTRSAASHNSSASAISSGSSEVSATSSARVSLGLIDTYA